MAYNNYGGGNRGYNRGNNGGNGYGRYNNNGNNNSNNGGTPKKHSGCSSGVSRKDGKTPYVRGWKCDKTHGLRAFIAGPNKKSHITKSGSGKEWENWTVKVTGPHGVNLHNCLYDLSTRKVIIQDLGIVMNPAKNYTGPFYRRK